MPQESNVVLVTGCSSGFGELIAKTLARAGHEVFATMRDTSDRNAEAAEALTAWARDNDARVHIAEMDVADDASVQPAVAKVLAEAGRIDVVVNNAGISAGGPIEAFDVDQMKQLFDINVWGPIRVDKAVLPQMRERRAGLLIHVSSTLGRILPRSGGLYPASKWAVEGLAESLHYQLVPFGIDLVILEPGSFPTPAVKRGMMPNGESIAAEYAALPRSSQRATAPGPDYAAPDPQEVADTVQRIIDTPAGERPLRAVVGPIFTSGVPEYNEVYEKARDHLVETLRRPDQAITWGR